MSKYTQAIILILFSTLTSTAAQVFFKLTSHNFSFSFSAIFDLWLWLGFISYALSAALLVLAFKNGELSILNPLQSVEFIWTLIASWLILKEAISIQNVIGISIVLLGVFLLTIPGGKKQ
jgi:uncharacterized membrane protein